MYVLDKKEGKTRLLNSLCEELVVNVDVTDRQSVLRHETLHRAHIILDLECTTISPVGRGLAAVVLLVNSARNGSTLRAGNPEIARPAMAHERLTDISICW